MIGLAMLILFFLVAVFAPLLANTEGLKATCPCNGVPFTPPSLSSRSGPTTSVDRSSP